MSRTALDALRPGLSGIRTDTSLFRPATYLDSAMDNLAVALIGGLPVDAAGNSGAAVGMARIARRVDHRAAVVGRCGAAAAAVGAGLQRAGHRWAWQRRSPLWSTRRLCSPIGSPTACRRREGSADESSIATVAYEAARDIRGPLIYATLVVLLAVVPIAVLGGRPGAFFGPMVLAYVLAVASAVLVALTVTPALTVTLFGRWRPPAHRSQASLRVRRGYASALQWFSRTPRLPLIAAGVILLVSVIALPLFHTSLIPQFQDRTVLVRLDAEPGTSNARMTEIATAVGDKLKSVPGVEGVARVRRAGGHG